MNIKRIQLDLSEALVEGDAAVIRLVQQGEDHASGAEIADRLHCLAKKKKKTRNDPWRLEKLGFHPFCMLFFMVFHGFPKY